MLTSGLLQMAELSTAHLSLDTRDWLDSSAASPHRPSILVREYGWMISTSVEDERSELPPDLELCLRFVRVNGGAWVLFDCDVDEREDLPVYDDDNAICREWPWGDGQSEAMDHWLPGIPRDAFVTWRGNVRCGWSSQHQGLEAVDPARIHDERLLIGIAF
jgi:hypothetical protein